MSKATRDPATRRVRNVLCSSVLLVAALFGVFCAALIHDYRLEEFSRQIRCRAHLSQIGAALQCYNDTYGTFPPAYFKDKSGAPAHSWRVLILPFLGEEELYRRYSFDEPWNGPNNGRLALHRPPVFACAARAEGGPRDGTPFVVMVSPDSAMRGARATSLASMSDAASTILVLEIPGTEVNWLEPRDADVLQFGLRVRGGHNGLANAEHPDGIWALFADGGLCLLKYSTRDDDLRTLLSTSASPESKRGATLRAIVSARGQTPRSARSE